MRPVTACNPAVTGAGTIVDPAAYLTCYKIKDTSGQPKFVKRQVEMATGVGDLRWELKRARELCVPTTRDGSPIAPTRDAFKCYQAKTAPGTPRFEKREVIVEDEFGTARLAIKKPATYCTPARDDGMPATDPDARLACFRASTAPGEPRFESRELAIHDGFGDLDMIAVKPHVFCIPAVESPLP